MGPRIISGLETGENRGNNCLLEKLQSNFQAALERANHHQSGATATLKPQQLNWLHRSGTIGNEKRAYDRLFALRSVSIQEEPRFRQLSIAARDWIH